MNRKPILVMLGILLALNLVFLGCGGSESKNTQITITGIDSKYNGKFGMLVLQKNGSSSAWAFANISGGSIKLDLLDYVSDEATSASGKYAVAFGIYESRESATNKEAPLWAGMIADRSIGEGKVTIAFSDFSAEEQTSISITGIDGSYNGKFGMLVLQRNGSNSAWAYGNIGTASITLNLLDWVTDQATAASGTYAVAFMIYESQASATAKEPFLWAGTIASKSISGASVSIAFSDFTAATAPSATTYLISGSGTSFSATLGGTVVSGATGEINTVLNAIRTAANGDDVSIQFGDGINALDIGAAMANFNNTGGTWGNVAISGRITGKSTATPFQVLTFDNGVSGTSKADITQTGGNLTYTLVKTGTGTLTITGGTITGDIPVNVASSSTNRSVVDIEDVTISGRIGVWVTGGTVNISGGTISSPNNIAVLVQNSNDVANISGGTVQGTGASASAISSFGRVYLTGTPTITSADARTDGGTICIRAGHSSGDPDLTVAATVTPTNTAAGGNVVYISPTASITPRVEGWPRP